MKILVTGAAGFIGMHLVQQLAARGDEVVGLDSINDYYDVNLKYARLHETGIRRDRVEWSECVDSEVYANYRFVRIKLENKTEIDELFAAEKFDKVCNLAAQPGVRYSLENPGAYIDSNVVGFVNILEASRHSGVSHLVYASSSSVYGANKGMPFSTEDNVDHPISIYAATKKSNELMAHCYSHLYGLPTTGLRFFTVYGPWGRPDMAPYIFVKAMLAGEEIKVFNHGDMKRDFTYVDDIVEGVLRVIDASPCEGEDLPQGGEGDAPPRAPYRIYNIGNGSPVRLLDFIGAIENSLGVSARKNFLPMQPGDVKATWADVDSLVNKFSFKPVVVVEDGVREFVNWFRKYEEF